MRNWLLWLCCPVVCAHGALTVDCAYFRVDAGEHYTWTESAPGLTDFANRDRRAGMLKVYLRNPGDEPVRVEAASLNGTPLERLRTRGKHEVIWWRTQPDPVPAHGCAEVGVRLRYPLTTEARLGLKTGERGWTVTIAVVPPPFRIETVAWARGGTRVTVVVQQLRPEPRRIERVFLDGAEVTERARILAPDFFQGICPVELILDKPLTPGSFHTYRVAAANGDSVACTLRTLDAFLRLGMYGASDLERNVQVGINCATHFRPVSRESLDRYALFGMKAAFHVNSSPPRPEVRGHPAVYAYLLHDEPDCWDYGAKEWPPPFRVGFHAPELVRAMKDCVEADPTKPVMITLDLTFKPANYFVYAQLADIVSPDCYPLTIGQPLTRVREVTAACRSAAGPRRVETIPQVDFEERKKKKTKFRRPPFAREVVIQYLYALGAGARGFSGWEWFDERAGWCTFHGAPNYPDVLDAVGQTFRRFRLVAPLILKAHPTTLAASPDDEVWVRTLVCGGEALLLVAVNDDYESLPERFVSSPKHSVTIRLPDIPWLRPGYAAVVGEGRFTPVPLRRERGKTELVLPALDPGALVLVARDERLAMDLLKRERRRDTAAAVRLLWGRRRARRQAARKAALLRHLTGTGKRFAVPATKLLSAYGTDKAAFWNPTGERYPGIEWWTEHTPRGGEWKVSVDPRQAGKPYRVFFQLEKWWGGGTLRIEVHDARGEVLWARDHPTWTGPIPNFTVTFPAAGDYVIRLLQTGKGKPGGRLSRAIFVVPADSAPPPLPWESGGPDNASESRTTPPPAD